MKIKNLVPYFLAIILLIWLTYFLLGDENIWQIIDSVAIGDFIVSLLISSVIFIISGLQLNFLIKRSTSHSIEYKDFILLPASMNLWSYLLPFRGGLIYSAFYIRLKYGIELSLGFSIGIFTFMLSISLAGIFGLYLSIEKGIFLSWFGLISLILFLSPFLLVLFRHIIKDSKNRYGKFSGKIITFIQRILIAFNQMFSDLKSTLFITSTTLISILFYIFWVYWSAVTFDFPMTLSSVVILALVLRLSVIARFIPGNIGIQEIISGATTSLMGAGIQEGILIALYIRVTALVIAIVLGFYSFILNKNIFKKNSILELWRNFKN